MDRESILTPRAKAMYARTVDGPVSPWRTVALQVLRGENPFTPNRTQSAAAMHRDSRTGDIEGNSE
jgi:hypothetical protein